MRALSDDEIAAFRARVRDAAARLFAEHGAAGVTMRRIATALGCSAMTPYRYFADREAIMAMLRADAYDRLATALEEAFAEPGTALERSAAVYRAYVAFALEDPSSYRLMFDETRPTVADHPDLARAALRAQAMMSAHVELLVAEGVVAGDPSLIGHMLWAATHGTLTLQLAGKLDPRIDPTALRAAQRAALLKALAP